MTAVRAGSAGAFAFAFALAPAFALKLAPPASAEPAG